MKFFQLIPTETNIDFIGKFRVFLAFSLLCFAGVGLGLWKKGLNFGIDFSGGTVLQVAFNEPIDPAEVRRLVAEAGEPDASVVASGTDGKEFMITARSASDVANQNLLDKRLIEKAGPGKLTIQSSDVVGPKVGAELKWAALQSLLYSIILITVYIWLRFDIRFAPGATIAMLHDLTMAVGFYLVTGHEFTITAVAALLTIAGYSVNDTIVIYDRVREMIKKGGDALPLGTTINKAINLTLSRTLLTAGVTLLSLFPIIIFCSGEIQDFAIAMVFGIFVGCYSTMYIASPLTIYVDKFLSKREQQAVGKPRPKPATT